MLNFWINIFDTSDFPARWRCGHWDEGHGWLHILSDLGVWSAYLAIPTALLLSARRRKSIPFRNLFFLFSAFILACGTTHLMEAIIFWWPAYRLAGILKFATALISWATVFTLVPYIPKALALRSPEELAREVAQRERVEIELRECEYRYRLLVAGVRDHAVFLLDSTGRIATWNEGAERIKGFTAEEIIGKHFSCFYPPGDVAAGKPEGVLQIVLETGRYEEEGWRVRKDGSRYWAQVTISAFHDADGQFQGFAKATRDLTAQREVEIALQASERRNQLLLDGVRDSAIFLLDSAGHIASWNVGAERLKGYAASEIIGRHFSCFYPPEDAAEKTQRVLQTVLETGRCEEEGWRVRKDGSRFWAHVVISAIHDPDGQFQGYAKAVRDVSARREAEQALWKSEQRFRAIFDQTFQFIGLMSADGTLLELNRTALAALGIAEEQVIGKKFSDTPWWSHDADQQDRFRDAVRRAAGGETVRFESHHRAADGRTIWVDFSLKPYVAEGNVVYLIPEGRDITDRKNTELALGESEERFRSAFESAPIGVALVGPGGKWLRVNRVLCELTGYTEEELLVIDFQTITHPEDLIANLDLLQKTLDGTTSGYQMEKRYIHKRGHLVHALLSVSLVRDGAGAPHYFVSQIVDISMRKEAERALAANEALLQQFVTHSPVAMAMFDRDMRFLQTSDRWQRDYGLVERAIIGASYYEVFPNISERWRAVHRRVLAGAIERCDEERLQHERDSPDWLQWECRPWRDAGGAIGGLIIFTQLINERVQEAERSMRLVMAARILADAHMLFDAAVGVIRTACEDRGWAVGEFWRVSPDGCALEFVGGWAAPDAAGFVRSCDGLKHLPGVGLPGRAWTSNSPQVVADLSADPEFVRKDEAAEHGLRSGIAFPVIVGDQVVGVFEFFARQPQPAVAEEVEFLEGLAGRLGQWMERKRAKDLLVSSEARFRAVFEASPSGLLLLGRDGRIVLANELTFRIFGWDKEELLGAAIQRLVPDSHRQRHPIEGAAFFAAPETSARGGCAELTGRRKDGSAFPVEIGLTPVEVGCESFVLASVVDITMRKRTEEALRLSEERLRVALENARHALWDWDVGSGAVHFDVMWAMVHGYEQGEITLDYAWWESSIHPDDKEAVLAALNGHLISDAPYDVEYRGRRKDGSWVWLNSCGRVQTRDSGGRPVRMMGTMHDISEWKRTESTLRKSVQDKEVMLREIHHRVKNNLAVVSSLFHLQATTINDPRIAKVLREAQDRVHSMALVHEHLYNSADLGSVAFGEYAKTLAYQILQTYQLPTTPVELISEIRDVPLTIEQAIPCGLILNELLANCLKHGFRNRDRGKVTLSIRAVDGVCEIRVADDGVGLPNELDVRAANSLGVRLVRILAGQLVGSVDYRSPGVGTEVRLTFPIQIPRKSEGLAVLSSGCSVAAKWDSLN